MWVMKRWIAVYIVIVLCLPWNIGAQNTSFPLPEVPQILASPVDRANYLAVHYWEHFDFKDNSLIEKPEITEQGLVDFISLLVSVTEQKEALALFVHRMTKNPKMQEHFMELSEHYLFDNFSPVYNEELYLLLVDELLKQSRLSVVQKERLLYQRKWLLKNRVNQVATDFSFVQRNGKRMSLKDVKADYILLYLNDPECSACQQTKEVLLQSGVLARWKNSGLMKILSVCTEGKTEGWKNISAPQGWIDGCDDQKCLLEEDLYDLRNLPALYLLDKEKKILLKNTTVLRLEQYLQINK